MKSLKTTGIFLLILLSVLLIDQYWTPSIKRQVWTALSEDSEASNEVALTPNYEMAKEDQEQKVNNEAARADTIQHNEAAKTSPAATAKHKMNLAHVMANSKPIFTPQMINNVKKFVFFIGYPRSGHSIVGTLMDAHPHVIISDQLCFFGTYLRSEDIDKERLFQKLYKESVRDVRSRSTTKKGYTLTVEGLWQGTYDDHIEVIGDKCGDRTTKAYLNDKQGFVTAYQSLKRSLDIPVRVIHVLRNPFDMISTDRIVYKDGRKGKELVKGQKLLTELKKSDNDKVNIPSLKIKEKIEYLFGQFDAVTEMRDSIFGKANVLELHNSDMVNNPRGTISKIFSFLEVDTTEHYLDVCAEKVFKSISRSRDLMVWPPEQVAMVEERMKNYEMLSRYNFTSD